LSQSGLSGVTIYAAAPADRDNSFAVRRAGARQIPIV
jgi:hypothetical protein